MAKSTKFSVTLPDGRIGHRTSATRNYTHVAVIESNADDEIAYCDRQIASSLNERGAAWWALRKEHYVPGTKTYAVIGWSSTAELAQKAANSAAKRLSFIGVQKPLVIAVDS